VTTEELIASIPSCTPASAATIAGDEPRPTRFTDELWQRTCTIRQAIEGLPFLQQLGEGTLPLDAFRSYLEQDALYLAGYAKALAVLASKAPTPTIAAFWARSAHTAAVVESSLHTELLAGGRLPSSDVRTNGATPSEVGGPVAARHSPTCLGYVSYLIATAATAPYPVAAAAVLPCFWIYAAVGARLAATANQVLTDPDHPYARWVAAYAGEEFQAEVVTARELVDTAAAGGTAEQREEMFEAFRRASVYEYLFWQTALHRQPWPLYGLL
jgi:thiaminase (transcriptional activator TenA)